MSFQVDPAALRAYATRLGDVERVTSDAERYVATYGNLGFHEQGIIGYAAPGHRKLMANLHELLARLSELGIQSQKALRAAADQYEKTDARSAAMIDGKYHE